jgi:hypothetical protein
MGALENIVIGIQAFLNIGITKPLAAERHIYMSRSETFK